MLLRPLDPGDFESWREVRTRNRDWLVAWEPRKPAGTPDAVSDRQAFVARCSARRRDARADSAFGFGVFVDRCFGGEVNLNSIQRGPLQNACLGYWIDERRAGHGYIPEAVVVALRFAFARLHLHRVEAAIVPRNSASLRVVEKLGFRAEGMARRYLEINGVWEDHLRFAMTAEDWALRGPELAGAWLAG